MSKWTVDYSKDLNESGLKLTNSAKRGLTEQRLVKQDLILVLTNGAWRERDGYILYNFEDEDIPEARMKRAWAAGLDDVTVALDPRNSKIVATARGWRLPHLRRRTRPPLWSPMLPQFVTADSLLLTRHARRRMQEGHLTREDLAYVIRFGKCLHRQGRVYYTLRRKDGGGELAGRWARLDGTTLVMSYESTVVITVWRDPKTGYSRLRRKPKRRPTALKPVIPPHLFN